MTKEGFRPAGLLPDRRFFVGTARKHRAANLPPFASCIKEHRIAAKPFEFEMPKVKQPLEAAWNAVTGELPDCAALRPGHGNHDVALYPE
jgi:hypothetical protein